MSTITFTCDYGYLLRMLPNSLCFAKKDFHIYVYDIRYIKHVIKPISYNLYDISYIKKFQKVKTNKNADLWKSIKAILFLLVVASTKNHYLLGN